MFTDRPKVFTLFVEEEGCIMSYRIDITPTCGVPFHSRVLPIAKIVLGMDV